MLSWYEYIAGVLRHARHSERGAALVEYALLLALIAIICLTAVDFFGSEVTDSFDSTGRSVEAATNR